MHTAPSVMEALTCLLPPLCGGPRQGKWAAGGARLTSFPIKTTLLYGCSFKEWIPNLVCRITQRYFKKYPCFTSSTIFIYATEIRRMFIFNTLFCLDTFSPTILKLFNAIRKIFGCLWSGSCNAPFSSANRQPLTVFFIDQTDGNRKGSSLDRVQGVWELPNLVAECCWRWGVPCHVPEHTMTTFISVLCE
jgi:hypothetical protein